MNFYLLEIQAMDFYFSLALYMGFPLPEKFSFLLQQRKVLFIL